MRVFNRRLEGLVKLFKENMKMLNVECIPYKILKRRGTLYSYFKDARGAPDGTLIPVKVPSKDVVRFRNRKGDLSQNGLGICTFGLLSFCVIPPWEGSAHDGQVLQSALRNRLEVLKGKYFKVYAGYALRKVFLAPYRGIRYHFRE